jgi:hypothetical protein
MFHNPLFVNHLYKRRVVPEYHISCCLFLLAFFFISGVCESSFMMTIVFYLCYVPYSYRNNMYNFNQAIVIDSGRLHAFVSIDGR